MPEKISLALGGAKKPAKPLPTNGIKRSHAALREDDDDAHDDGRAQPVSHFDKTAGGAIDEDNKEKDRGPLVIAPQANRDWKEAGRRKRQRHALPENGGQAQTVAAQAAVEAKLEAAKPAIGMNIKSKASTQDEHTENGHDEMEVAQEVVDGPSEESSIKQQTDDERAMDALLGKTTKSELVLPAVNTEEEAFDHDVRYAPDMATLDDYARVPVEQFGAALLRGMGWKEGQGIGSERGKKIARAKVPERRPALLGIGAKEEAAVAQEMGAWGRATKKGGEVKIYNPVLLRDKKTGETYTEEELARKKEADEKRLYEEEFDRKEREREKKERRREGSRDRDGDREKDRRRRSRSRDGDRRLEDRKHRDSARDDEYDRRKEKERRRRDRDHDDEYDPARSKRHDSGRERQRDRSRERDRRR